MADCDHDQPSTPELDAAIARQALAEGDLRHAAFHVASALSSDPHRADLLALVDQVAGAAGGAGEALALWPIEDAPWFGAVAVHARLLGAADAGRAFDLLCQVTVARPDVPFLGWAEAFADRVPPDVAAVGLSRLLALDGGDPVATAALGPALALAGRLGALHPDDAEIPSVASMLARRAGRLEEAPHFVVAIGDLCVRVPSGFDAGELRRLVAALRG